MSRKKRDAVRKCAFLLAFTGLLALSPLIFTGKFRERLVPPEQVREGLIVVREALVESDPGRQYPLEPKVCPETGDQPEAVIFVPSRPENAEERAAVRETWGFHARLCNVTVVFGFGSFESTEVQHETVAENCAYGDLLQTSSVKDAYHNQSRLVLSFFEWAAVHCQRTKFIGKADEDAWLNIPELLKYLRLPQAKSSITGHFIHNERALRLPREKWFLTKEEYPDDFYPPYAVGQFYAFPTDLIPAVLSASRQLRIIWLDDVFFAGLVPKFLGLSLTHIPEYHKLYAAIRDHDCCGRSYFIIHAVHATQKRRIFYDPCMEQYRESKCPMKINALSGTKRSAKSTVSQSPKIPLADLRPAAGENFIQDLIMKELMANPFVQQSVLQNI